MHKDFLMSQFSSLIESKHFSDPLHWRSRWSLSPAWGKQHTPGRAWSWCLSHLKTDYPSGPVREGGAGESQRICENDGFVLSFGQLEEHCSTKTSSFPHSVADSHWNRLRSRACCVMFPWPVMQSLPIIGNVGLFSWRKHTHTHPKTRFWQ